MRFVEHFQRLMKMPIDFQQNKRFIIVAHEDDYMLVAHAMHAGVPVQNTEFVLTGILRQQIDYDQFTLTPPPSAQHHGLLEETVVHFHSKHFSDVRQVYQQQQLMYTQQAHAQHAMHR